MSAKFAEFCPFVLAKSRRKLATKFGCKALGLSLNQTKFCYHLGEISHPPRRKISFCRNFARTNTALAFKDILELDISLEFVREVTWTFSNE